MDNSWRIGSSCCWYGTACFTLVINTLNSGVAVAIEFIGPPCMVAVFTGRTWREYMGAFSGFAGLLTLAGAALFSVALHRFQGLVAIIASGVLWGNIYCFGTTSAHGSSGLDNLTISLLIGWIIQSCLIGFPAVKAVIVPAQFATWARADGGWFKLLVLLFIMTLGASIVRIFLTKF